MSSIVSQPALILITGPSHSGKTSVARSVLHDFSRPVAYLAIDDIMQDLDLGDQDQWEDGLPAAYDVAFSSARALLRRGFLVLLESTLTFVPSPDRPPQFHANQLTRAARLAAETQAGCLVVRLTADLDEIRRRRARTARLTSRIVDGTWALHARQALHGCPVVELDTTTLTPDDAARELRQIIVSQVGGAEHWPPADTQRSA